LESIVPITFYATISAGDERPYMPAVPVMLPASSWSRFNLRAPRLPAHVVERAADSGGFVATFKWGDYRYSPAQYVDWLCTFDPSWAATMDYCCEPEIADNEGVVRERQERTTEMAWRFWRDYRDTPWAWVPTVQGWEVADYRRHAAELRPLAREMSAHYGDGGGAFRVGIGTLCRRADAEMVQRVVAAVADELPDVPLHLWGVKLSVLRSPRGLRNVASVDSAAWNAQFGQGIEKRRASGLTEREWYYHVALPEYLAKVAVALGGAKQLPLL
jgi:hypothetical protein